MTPAARRAVEVPRSPASTLAGWTSLEPTRFGDQYTGVRPTGAGPLWQELVAFNPDPAGLILAAAEAAERHNFLDRLALQVARVEEADGKRTREELDALLRAMPQAGMVHALTDAARGLADPAMFHDLIRVLDATAFVTEGNAVIGTAFLVGADLALTAAHVVFERSAGPTGARYGPALRDIALEFPPPRGAGSERRVLLHAEHPVAASSPPFGEPPGRMHPVLSDLAEANLDYALLRLATRVEGITPIDLDKAPEARVDRLCFIIGFPNGGRHAKFDAATVLEIPAVGGRLWHAVNAVPGMSGSCCVGEEGPVGLHEGGLAAAAGTPVRNRAVTLRSVRRDLQRQGIGRLDRSNNAPGFALHSGPAVVAWRRKGRQLAGPLADRWSVALAAATGADMESTDEGDGFHPWFDRPDLQNWFAAAKLRTARRVALVHGPAGAGSSFAVDLLAGFLDEPDRDLIRLTPAESGEWSWHHAAARLAELDASHQTRTGPGGLRYDDVPSVLANLRSWRGLDRDRGDAPLYIAIDVKDLGLNDREWREFVAQASTHEWLRLMIVGLSEEGRDEIGEVVRQGFEPSPQSFAIGHAGIPELEAFVRQLRRLHGLGYGPAERAALRDEWTDRARLHHACPELATAEAVLLALGRRSALLREHAPAGERA